MPSDPSPSTREADLFDELRVLLLAREQERLESLEQKIKDLNLRDDQLRELLDELNQQHEDTSALIERIKPSMSGMVRYAIRDSGDEMAEILGPVMGEAIRVQIRDSRDEMVDTLYPIIGATIQKAINEFAREFQRNIDQRLSSTFGAEGMLRRLWARLRGVHASELALRDAFPFEVRQVFLIHRTSGILIAHSDPENINSDIISAMLTAIRSFATDAFQGADELDEIQFGDGHIILKNGAHAYLAAVISGVEPEGFRAKLSEFVSDLHLRNNSALRDFKGDPQDLPALGPQLAQLAAAFNMREEKRPATRQQKLGYALLALTGILFATLICFYLVFTVRLFPVAFSAPTSTPTMTMTATPTLMPTSTPTPLPTLTATPPPTPQPDSSTPGISVGSVWARAQPGGNGQVTGLLLENIPVKIYALQDHWLEISWTDSTGEHRGWVISTWIEPDKPIPPEFITPSP